MTKSRLNSVAFMLFASQLFLFGIPLACSRNTTVTGPSEPISKEYFGMHIHGATNAGLWPAMPFGAWRLSDAGVSWADLEPERDEWNFERLDGYIETSSKRGVDVLLPLAHPPTWASARPNEPSGYGRPGLAAEPRDMDDWSRYVRTVAKRYKNRVRYYEIWNEPNTHTLYSGDIDTLIELTRRARRQLKEVDPDIQLVSPSFVFDDGVKKLDQFLSNGGARYIDIVGFHFYVIFDKPEALVPMVDKVRRVMKSNGVDNKPLWNTETGWLIESRSDKVDAKAVGFPKETPVLSYDDSGAYVARALLLGRVAGLDRFYWYAWDNRAMGFAEKEGKQLKPTAHAYARAQDWLRDSVVESCQSNPMKKSGDLWVCRISRGASRQAWIVWDTDKESPWSPPTDWKAVEIQTLDGRVLPIEKSDKPVAVGPRPVLIASDAWRASTKADAAKRAVY